MLLSMCRALSYLTLVTSEIKAQNQKILIFLQTELEVNHSLQLVPRLRMCGTLECLLFTFIAYCFYVLSRISAN
jgi:hypothetical protein